MTRKRPDQHQQRPHLQGADPLDRLADLTFPAPQPSRMQADIARARARFVEASLHPAPVAEPGFMARLRARLTYTSAGLAGGVLAAGLAVVVILPLQQRPDPGAEMAGIPPEALDYGRSDASALPDPPLSPVQPAPSAPVATLSGEVTLPPKPESSREFSELDPGSGAAPVAPPLAGAAPGDQAAAGEGTTLASSAPPVTRLPRIGPAPRLADLKLPPEDAPFSGGGSVTIAGDMDGLWLETESGRHAIPLETLPAGTGLELDELFLLPARGAQPPWLVIMGERGDERHWQIFRVEEDALNFEPALTAALREAVTPGQVEGMLLQLPAAD